MISQYAPDFAEALAGLRVLPVVVLPTADGARDLGKALVEGGLPVAEVTFRTAAAEDAIRAMSMLDGLLVGAGTVTTPEQVDRAVTAGARFVVSPGLSAAVVTRCVELGVPSVPGVATPTDMMAAQELGLDVVKFFPAQAMGGIATIRALSAPFPAMRFVPTGGITAASAPDYLGHPAVIAVGGSWMVPAAALERRDWEAVRELTRQAVSAVRTEASR